MLDGFCLDQVEAAAQEGISVERPPQVEKNVTGALGGSANRQDATLVHSPELNCLRIEQGGESGVEEISHRSGRRVRQS